MNKRILVLAKKNPSETSRIVKKFNEKSSDTDFVINTFDEIEFFIGEFENIKKTSVFVNGEDILSFDLIYLRSGQINKLEISSTLSLFLKKNNANYKNSNVNNIISGSKIFQMMRLDLEKISIPKTIFIPRSKLLSKLNLVMENLSFPIIMKGNNSHLGSDNHLISDETELKLKVENNPEVDFIFQEFIPNSFDYRFLVLGQEYVGSGEKRVRDSDTTHKNNVKLGAREVFLDLDTVNNDIKELAIKVARLFSMDTAGIDILESSVEKKHYILEANPAPGITFSSPEEESLYKYLIDQLS